MVYFSVCSQSVEESQRGKPRRFHYLPTPWLWTSADLLCGALSHHTPPLSQLSQIGTINYKHISSLGGTSYLIVALISICTNIYTILIILGCVVTTCKAVSFPGLPVVKLLCGARLIFDLAFPPWNPVSLGSHLVRHRFCRKEWDITPSLTGKITGRGPSGTQRGRHNFSECVFQLPLLKFSCERSPLL